MQNKPDLVSADPDTSRLLVVEVKDKIRKADETFFLNQMRNYAHHLGPQKTIYYVLVDNDHIRFFSEKENRPLKAETQFDTRQTLRNYLVHGAKSFSGSYLTGITQAWLRDLALKWQSENPAERDKISPDIIDLLSKADVRFP